MRWYPGGWALKKAQAGQLAWNCFRGTGAKLAVLRCS
jgi:hypothetical protein